MEDYLAINLIVFGVQVLSQGVTLAMFHLDHNIKSNEVLFFFNQLVQGAA